MPDTDGLSVDWDKYYSPEESLIRTGLTYRFNTEEFKDLSRFLVFKLHVGSIRLIESVLSVIHTPVFHGEPAPREKPNNQSHSSIIGSDEEVRLKLRDSALEVSVVMDFVQHKAQLRRNGSLVVANFE